MPAGAPQMMSDSRAEREFPLRGKILAERSEPDTLAKSARRQLPDHPFCCHAASHENVIAQLIGRGGGRTVRNEGERFVKHKIGKNGSRADADMKMGSNSLSRFEGNAQFRAPADRQRLWRSRKSGRFSL